MVFVEQTFPPAPGRVYFPLNYTIPGTDAESFTMILLILEHDLSFVIARIPRARPSSRNAAGHKNEILGRKMLENSVEFCSRNSAAFLDPLGPLSPHNKRKRSSLYILNDSRANRMERS